MHSSSNSVFGIVQGKGWRNRDSIFAKS